MDLLTSGSGILLAVLGLGFVIFIHELGHFLFAKWAGVRVDIFSIGFGPIIWSRSIGETEYALSLLPLGGYVGMREQADGSGRTMAEVSPPWRAAILFAGVLFNAISSFLLLLCLAWYGMPMHPPVVGQVAGELVDKVSGELVESPAYRLGLRPGDRIVSYAGEEPRSLEDVIAISIDRRGEPVQMVIERAGERLELPPADEAPVHLVASKSQGRPSLGVNPASSRRITAARGAGAEALDLAGWYVERVEGEDVSGLIGEELQRRLTLEVGREITLGLRRGGEEREVTLRYAGGDVASVGAAALGLPVVVEGLVAGLPAEAAGLAVGDILIAVDDEAVSSREHFSAAVRRRGEQPFTLRWLHRAEDATWQPRAAEVAARHHPPSGQRLVGVRMDNRRAGVLPHLPPALGFAQSPLAAAGVQPGDAIVAVVPPGEDQGEAITIHLLSEPEALSLHFDKAADTALRTPYDPPLLAKFFGAEPRPGIHARMLGTRVVEVGGPGASATLLRVEDPRLEDDERYQAIDLAGLPEAARERLLGGLRPGDWVVDATPLLREEGGGLRLDVVRASGPAALRTISVEPAPIGIALGFYDLYTPPYRLDSWLEAFPLAAHETLSMLTVTFKIIPLFFTPAEEGGIDASKSLAGPIGIFSELKARAEMGFASFLKLLALLGLNLVIVNLLPIPIADGGRLLMLGIEVVIRRPVPQRVENAVNLIGFAFIVALMLFVIGIDVLREMDLH